VATAACPTGTTSGTTTIIWNMTQQ
jgi:hypothetical protein